MKDFSGKRIRAIIILSIIALSIVAGSSSFLVLGSKPALELSLPDTVPRAYSQVESTTVTPAQLSTTIKVT